MAALYGTLEGNRGEVSRLGSPKSGIRSTLQTWNAKVTTRLDADGSLVVEARDIDGNRRVVLWEGNIDDETRPAPGRAERTAVHG